MSRSLSSGSGIVIPIKKLPFPVRFECCDCGLVHMYVFSTGKDSLRVNVYRDEEATVEGRKIERATRRSKKKTGRTRKE